MRIYKFTIFKYLLKEVLWIMVIALLISLFIVTLEKNSDFFNYIFCLYFWGGIFACAVFFVPWDINYIFNDWGKELHIDKRRQELLLKKGREEIFLRFSEIDCVRKYHNRSARFPRTYYRIRLKKPNDYVFFISRLTVENLEKEMETVTFYYTEEAFALIPNWKVPSKRTLIEKDTR